ncbi:hypothetical protein KA183_14520 [bacterium]|nr:hypothetical protein [bacterium]
MRQFTQKLVYIELTLLLLILIGITALFAPSKGIDFRIVVQPVLAIVGSFCIIIFLHKKIRLIIPIWEEMCRHNAILAKLDRVEVFISFAVWVSFVLITFKWTFTSLATPISIALASNQQLELAEKIHALDSHFGGLYKRRAVNSIVLHPKIIKKQIDLNAGQRIVEATYGVQSEQAADFERCKSGILFNSKKYDDAKASLDKSSEMFDQLGMKVEVLSTQAAKISIFWRCGDRDGSLNLLSNIVQQLGSLPLSYAKIDLVDGLIEKAKFLRQFEMAKSLRDLSRQLKLEAKQNHLPSDFLETELPFLYFFCSIAAVGILSAILNLLATYYFRSKKNKILSSSTNPEEQIHALEFLIPASLVLGDKKSAKQYSQRLLKLSDDSDSPS